MSKVKRHQTKNRFQSSSYFQKKNNNMELKHRTSVRVWQYTRLINEFL